LKHENAVKSTQVRMYYLMKRLFV